jgi:hypothetical protein
VGESEISERRSAALARTHFPSSWLNDNREGIYQASFGYVSRKNLDKRHQALVFRVVAVL